LRPLSVHPQTGHHRVGRALNSGDAHHFGQRSRLPFRFWSGWHRSPRKPAPSRRSRPSSATAAIVATKTPSDWPCSTERVLKLTHLRTEANRGIGGVAHWQPCARGQLIFHKSLAPASSVVSCPLGPRPAPGYSRRCDGRRAVDRARFQRRDSTAAEKDQPVRAGAPLIAHWSCQIPRSGAGVHVQAKVSPVSGSPPAFRERWAGDGSSCAGVGGAKGRAQPDPGCAASRVQVTPSADWYSRGSAPLLK